MVRNYQNGFEVQFMETPKLSPAEISIHVVSVPEVGMAGMNVLLVG